MSQSWPGTLGIFTRGKKWVRRKPTTALLVASLVALAAALGWIVWRSELFRRPITTGIAVLPFKPLVAADRDEVLEAGMADTLIAKLSTSREMNVPSLAAARKYDDQTRDPVATGGALRVSSVLEGNLKKSGDRIRVTARLIRVADRKTMWSGTFDEKFTDVFQVEDAIAEKVAAALKLHLSDEDQQRLTKRHTEKPEAYQAYLTGRFYWHKFTPKGWRKSIEFFKQAAAKDPNYALAYAGIAESYSLLAETGDASPREIFPQARTYAEKALKLDDALSEAHLALGIVELFYDWNLTAAKVKLEHARELNPSDPQVHHFYGHYLQWAGRYEEAAAEMKRGVDLDPTNLVINAEYGWTFYFRHQYDEALAHYRKTLELDPNFVLASVWMAQALEQKQMYGEAMAELERARKIDDWSWIVAEIGCVNALSNKREEARKVVAELIARSAHEYIDETLIAYIFVALGDTDQTFAWLNKAYESRGGNLPWITVEPKFDSIRSDPRFGALVRRMRLR